MLWNKSRSCLGVASSMRYFSAWLVIFVLLLSVTPWNHALQTPDPLCVKPKTELIYNGTEANKGTQMQVAADGYTIVLGSAWNTATNPGDVLISNGGQAWLFYETTLGAGDFKDNVIPLVPSDDYTVSQFYGLRVNIAGNNAIVTAPGSSYNNPPAKFYIFTEGITNVWSETHIMECNTVASGCSMSSGGMWGTSTAMTESMIIIGQENYGFYKGIMYIFTETSYEANDWAIVGTSGDVGGRVYQANALSGNDCSGSGDYFGRSVAIHDRAWPVVGAVAPFHCNLTRSTDTTLKRLGAFFIFWETVPGDSSWRANELKIGMPTDWGNGYSYFPAHLVFVDEYLIAVRESMNTGGVNGNCGAIYMFKETVTDAHDWQDTFMGWSGGLEHSQFPSRSMGRAVSYGGNFNKLAMGGSAAQAKVFIWEQGPGGWFNETTVIEGPHGSGFGYSLKLLQDYVIVVANYYDTVTNVDVGGLYVIDLSERAVNDSCASSPCQNGAECNFWHTCYNSDYAQCHCHVPGTQVWWPQYTSCNCTKGWDGDWCEIEIDECLSFPCNAGATCNDYIGFYNCTCPLGYTDFQCETDINECASSPCAYGDCNNLIGAYTCDCTAGWTGYDCDSNIDECASSPCVMGQGDCIDFVNGYECNCTDGWEDVNCQTNIDECKNPKNPCQNGGTCTDSLIHLQYSCNCTAGFAGPSCSKDVDECLSCPCNNGGVCFQLDPPEYGCNCTGTGYEGGECETNVDDCASDPCKAQGICHDEVLGFSCECAGTGRQGVTCEVDVDDCLSSPCLNGANCTDTGKNKFECDCASIGADTDEPLCNTVLDECASMPCQNGGLCTDDIYKFVCDCTGTGSEGKRCHKDIDDCLSMPCSNGGLCIDQGLNSFRCNCLNDTVGGIRYIGDLCSDSVDVDDCLSAPCHNGGECEDAGTSAFYCLCPSTYNGKTCTTPVSIDDLPTTVDVVLTMSFPPNDTVVSLSVDLPTLIAKQLNLSSTDVLVEVTPTGLDGEFAVTVKVAASEGLTITDIETNLQDPTGDLAQRTNGNVGISAVLDEEEDGGDGDNADNSLLWIIIYGLGGCVIIAVIIRFIQTSSNSKVKSKLDTGNVKGFTMPI